MIEFLKKIGITQSGSFNEYGAYTIDLRDSDEYGRVYSLLEKSDLVQEVLDTSQVTLHTTNVTYESDDYRITIMADLDTDLYKVVVREI